MLGFPAEGQNHQFNPCGQCPNFRQISNHQTSKLKGTCTQSNIAVYVFKGGKKYQHKS